MRIAVMLASLCLVVVHSPDGNALLVEARSIVIIRNLHNVHEKTVAAGTKAIIYADGHKLGVRENQDEVQQLIEECGR